MGSQTTVSYSNSSSESSSICYVPKTPPLSPETSYSNIQALKRPFESLRSILKSPDFYSRSDATIVLDRNREIPIHSNVLCAKNLFFKNLFYGGFGGKEKLEMKELAKDYDVGFDSLVAVLDYLYTEKSSPLPEGVCVCVDDECSHIGCWPKVNFMVEVLYVSFVFQIPELVSLYESHLLDILDSVAIDDILMILYVASMCNKVCDKLCMKCIEIVVKSDIDVITLEKALPYDIMAQIIDLRIELGLVESRTNSYPNKRVKRMHMALDSNDIELVKMLLKEGYTNVDDAYALHYAAAYCDPNTTKELLDLEISDVNYRNSRGYTVLHVAAMRKEPNVIKSLLIKGARPFDLTPDGKKALQILKRFTRLVDYDGHTEEGKGSMGRLCMEIVEQAEKTYPSLKEAFASPAVADNDLLRGGAVTKESDLIDLGSKCPEKEEAAILTKELNRLNEENKKLREMLSRSMKHNHEKGVTNIHVSD